MTRELGPDRAIAFGIGHEIAGDLRGQPREEAQMDLHNNFVGVISGVLNLDSAPDRYLYELDESHRYLRYLQSNGLTGGGTW